MGGVKAIQPQPRRGDLVQHRRFHMRMAVVAGFLPAVIVAHEEDDVRSRLGGEEGTTQERANGEEGQDVFHGLGPMELSMPGNTKDDGTKGG